MAKKTSKRKPAKKAKHSRANRFMAILAIIIIVLIVVSYLFYSSWKNNAQNHLEQNAMIVETPMGEVHYASIGEGDVILVLHGIFTGWDFINVFKPFASSGFKVICPSRPGYPGTPLSSGPSFQDQADLIKEFLDALKIQQKVYIITTSTGGPVAYYFATKYPNRCKGIIFQDANLRSTASSLYHPETNGQPFDFIDSEGLNSWFNIIAARYKPTSYMNRMLNKSTFYEKSKSAKIAANLMNNKEEKEKLKEWVDLITPSSLRKAGTENDLRNLESFEVIYLSKLNMPTMAIHSRVNRLTSPGLPEWMQKQNPMIEVYSYEGLGPYFWMGDEWEGLQHKMLEFLKSSSEFKVIPGISPFGKTWVSRADGAMLSIDQNGNYTLDFPSVEDTDPWKGSIRLDNNKIYISLENHRDLCNKDEGIYTFKIQEGELMLSAAKDRCKIRKERFTDTWFQL